MGRPGVVVAHGLLPPRHAQVRSHAPQDQRGARRGVSAGHAALAWVYGDDPESPWAGLTELTNRNGSMCDDSCPTQAWSAGCIIDLYDDASKYSLDGSH